MLKKSFGTFTKLDYIRKQKYKFYSKLVEYSLFSGLNMTNNEIKIDLNQRKSKTLSFFSDLPISIISLSTTTWIFSFTLSRRISLGILTIPAISTI